MRIIQQPLLQLDRLLDMLVIDEAVLAVAEVRGHDVDLVFDGFANGVDWEPQLCRTPGCDLQEDYSNPKNVHSRTSPDKFHIHRLLALLLLIVLVVVVHGFAESMVVLQLHEEFRREVLDLVRNDDVFGVFDLDRLPEIEELDPHDFGSGLKFDQDVLNAEVPVQGAGLLDPFEQLADFQNDVGDDTFPIRLLQVIEETRMVDDVPLD